MLHKFPKDNLFTALIETSNFTLRVHDLCEHKPTQHDEITQGGPKSRTIGIKIYSAMKSEYVFDVLLPLP